MNWLKKKAKKFKKKAKKAAKKLGKSIKKAVKKVKKAIKKTVKKVKRVIKKIKRAAKKVYKKIKRAAKKAVTKVKRAVKKFKKAATKSIKQIGKAAKKIYKKAKKITQKKIQKIKRSVKKTIQTFKKVGKSILAKGKSLVKSVPKKAGKYVGKTIAKIKTSPTIKKLVKNQLAHQIRLQKVWKSVCNGTSALGAGFVDGIASNGTFGIVGTLNKNDEAYGANNLYHIGKILSDIGSIVVGGVGMAGGSALAGGGLVLDATGIGAIAGVPANVAGAAIATSSGVIATSGTKNIIKDASDLISNIKKSGNDKAKIVKPEAAATGSKKHGVKWQEGPARAKATGNAQGQWGKEDLDFATEKANSLGAGESGYFDLPAGATSKVHMPDGTTKPAKKIWIRNNGTGTWHGYPMP